MIDKVFKSGHGTDFRIVTTETVSRELSSAGSSSTAKPAAEVDVTPAKRARVEIGKPKKAAMKKEIPESSPEDKKAKTIVQKKAADLKMRFLAVTAMHTNIQRNIENDDKYEWARNALQKSRLESVMTKLNDKIGEQKFNGVWVASDIASAKAEFGEDLSVHFAKFVETDFDAEKLDAMFSEAHAKFCEGP